VGRVLRMPAVRRVITLGVCSDDIDRPSETDLAQVSAGRHEIYPYRRRSGQSHLELCGHRWPTIQALGAVQFSALLLTRIPTRDVYVTIDKDALRPADAVTNWDQGELSLDVLLELIRDIAAHHRIVGADVLGDWSVPRYSPGLDRWLKRAESLLDQPRGPPGNSAINEQVNVRLMSTFADVMAS
jgi:hypothetical protein